MSSSTREQQHIEVKKAVKRKIGKAGTPAVTKQATTKQKKAITKGSPAKKKEVVAASPAKKKA